MTSVPATTLTVLDRTVGEVLDAPSLVDAMRDDITAGAVYVVPTGIDNSLLAELRAYLSTVGRSSLPAYHPIELFARAYGYEG